MDGGRATARPYISGKTNRGMTAYAQKLNMVSSQSPHEGFAKSTRGFRKVLMRLADDPLVNGRLSSSKRAFIQ